MENIRNIIIRAKPGTACIEALEVRQVLRVIATSTHHNDDAEGTRCRNDVGERVEQCRGVAVHVCPRISRAE